MKINAKEYADKWSITAKQLEKDGVYNYLSKIIDNYKVILEVGCGSGESTLELLKHGHIIHVVDNNEECINKAMALIKNNGYIIGKDVFFYFGNFLYENVKSIINDIDFDLVINWNPSAYLSETEKKQVVSALIYSGYDLNSIQTNFDSNCIEFLQMDIANYSANRKIPLNLVDRTSDLSNIKDYFEAIMKSFNYSDVLFFEYKTIIDASKGISFSIKGEKAEEKIDMCYISAIYSVN